jgi:hypothetical protein
MAYYLNRRKELVRFWVCSGLLVDFLEWKCSRWSEHVMNRELTVSNYELVPGCLSVTKLDKGSDRRSAPGNQCSQCLEHTSLWDRGPLDLLPQRSSFTVVYFVAQVMVVVVVPLANQHHQHHQQIREVVRRKLRLHCDDSRWPTVATVVREMARIFCVRKFHPLQSPDLAICQFCSFGCLKKQLQ